MDPQIEAMLAAAPAWPPVSSMPVEELRANVRASSLAFPPLDVPLGGIVDDAIEGPGGPIPIRIYTPEGDGPFPGVVYFHGGGWVVGDLDTQDMIARGLAAGAGAVVVSVDYRLAPEHPFPAAPDDAWAATLWTANHAADLGIDGRLAVAGDSAGANLAAGVALRARDAGAPRLAAQVMFYGSGNYPSEETPSAREFANGPLLSRADVDYFWSRYLADPEKDQHNPLASPIRAKDHKGLPPAYMGTAEIDPSRDDGERFAAKLADAGVPVELKRYPGMVHGFVSWLALLPGARAAMDDACAFLKRAFAAQA
jgi:acetyl esterase